MENLLTLEQILDLGGKIAIYRVNGTTNSIGLSKLLREKNISFNEEKYLVYLPYSNIHQIQAVYLVDNPNDKKCKLKEVYNKLNEL